MKQMLIQGGKAVVAGVPAPIVSAKNTLIQVAHSGISIGPRWRPDVRVDVLQRALKQPENVKRIREVVR
jgi:hypothetical protein